MAGHDHERMKDLFAAALRCAPAERSAYLDRTCGRDLELRAAVESLLAANEGASGFLAESPALSADSRGVETDETATNTLSASRGQTIDRYHLLEKLGEGGMGEVWLAEQRQPVHRRVALKLIKAGMDTAHVVARFEAERQALALMDHPVIAKVFDAGATPAGRPYFVMEHVTGLPITDHCDQQRLGLAERLAVFVEVCEGVQHAHQKAVLHRDLKPSNVLVASHEGRVTPKIIDFGVAKAMAQPLTERSLHTGIGMPIGTLGYMSPEQADPSNLDVDTRADVYSLGVLLYELLVGVQPFERQRLLEAGWSGVGKLLREHEPPTPSKRLDTLSPVDSESSSSRRGANPLALRKQLVGDLDWITMRAIEPNRERRYASPAALADDIRRHLRNEPVLAGSPGPTYRARKFARRHRFGVTAAAALALAIAAGLIGTSLSLLRARRAEAEALKQARTSERVSGFLADLLASVDPERMGNTLLDELRQRVEHAARVRGADEPQVASRLATFDAALSGVNVFDVARHLLDREILAPAGSAMEEQMSSEPLVSARLQATLGATYQTLALSAAAESYHRQALETRRRVLGPEHPESMQSMKDLATALQDQGRHADATTLLEEALRIQREVLGPEHPDTLRSMRLLCRAIFLQHRDDAERFCRDTVEQNRRLLGDSHPDTAASMRLLGDFLSDQGLSEEVEKLYVAALESHRRGSRLESDEALICMNNLANLYIRRGRLAESEQLFLQVLEVRRRIFGPDHRFTLAAEMNLGRCYRDQGRHREAERLFARVVATRRIQVGEDDALRREAIDQLAMIYIAQGRYDDAKVLKAELLDLYLTARGEYDPRAVSLLQSLASLYLATADWKALRPHLAALERTVEQASADARWKNNYAMVLLLIEPAELRDPQAALRFALDAAAATERKNATILDTLALAYHTNGRTAEARRTLAEAVSLLPPGRSPERDELEAHLAEYEEAREQEAAKGGD